MRRIVLLALLVAGPVQAETWVALDGPAIRAALAARVLGYPDGTLQDFFADGRTLYGKSFGRWKVEGGTYCSQWPPSDLWSCYTVLREARGLDLKFIAPDGSETVGRYVDLQ